MREERPIRRLTPSDWRAFRDVRLQALADAPLAFGSSLVEERSRPKRTWRERLTDRGCFAAWNGDRPIGIACGIASDEIEGGVDLISMWVHPDERGRHVGGRLIDAVLAWAAQRRYREVRLWVVAGNAAAEFLYERNGFRRTGRTQPYPRDERHVEIEMRREV